MRRTAPVLIVALAACSPALAARLPNHAGTPVLPLSSSSTLPAHGDALLQLKGTPGGGTRFALGAVGGRLISPRLSLWRLRSAAARRLLPVLRAEGVVQSVTPDAPVRPLDAAPALNVCTTDPLCPQEWWWGAVGAYNWTPPGPGVPVTMIDSGTDLSHEEFSARPDTTALNTQTVTPVNPGEQHGTATASVVGAPANTVGLVGIYPLAKLQLWDASPTGVLTVGDEIAGLSAAIAHGPGVINLSLGGTERLPVEEHAILSAFATGSLIVAAAGNLRDEGDPAVYPAGFAHVLTVGAIDEGGSVTSFSSSSPKMDLVAPGQDIPVAVPQAFNPNRYDVFSGTSFSAPLTSGAAAGVWTLRPTLTNTQLFDVMRHSASGNGWSRTRGYGVLDVAAAVGHRAPAPDPQEPNEDVFLVKPGGLARAGHPALTSPARKRATIAARLARGDDSEDVYRAYLPAHAKLVVNVRTNANIDLEVWGRRTRTVFERGAAAKRDLLGLSAHAGARPERVVVSGRGGAQYVYVDVFLGKTPREAGYKLILSTARR